MSFRAAPPEFASVSEDQIRQQLAAIDASATFHQVDRLKRFLNFVVSETAAGRGDNLKEYLIGTQVFDKETSFDPRTDPIVRVQARHLRARLARYYQEEGQNDEIVIDLPKGGYLPVFHRHDGDEPRPSVAAALVSRNTIALLPFTDFSPEGNLDFFCKGICHEITHALAAMGELRVIAWDPARPGIPGQRGPGLDAAVVVTGGIRKCGEQLRVTVQLVDGATGIFLWSATINGLLPDQFALEEQVACAVASRLKEAPTDVRRGSRRPNENPAARNLYLHGRYHLDQRTEEGIQKALEFFEKSVAEDSQYAPAYSGLADAYGLLAHYGVVAPAEVWAKAASRAATAVMLDENSAEAYTSLAHVRSTQNWDWQGSQREFLHAIALDPRYPRARHWYAMACLAPLGRIDEALEELAIAQSLDPLSSIIARDVAVGYYYKRDFETALERCDQAIGLNPYFSPAYGTLGLIQEQRHEYEEALAALERANHFSPENPRIRGSLARVFAVSGKRKQALRIISELHTLSLTRYVSPFDFACIYFELGQAEEGFEWLAKAFDDRCFELICLNVDPRFDSWKSDSRFTALSSRLGLPPSQ